VKCLTIITSALLGGADGPSAFGSTTPSPATRGAPASQSVTATCLSLLRPVPKGATRSTVPYRSPARCPHCFGGVLPLFVFPAVAALLFLPTATLRAARWPALRAPSHARPLIRSLTRGTAPHALLFVSPAVSWFLMLAQPQGSAWPCALSPSVRTGKWRAHSLAMGHPPYGMWVGPTFAPLPRGRVSSPLLWGLPPCVSGPRRSGP